MLLVGFAHESSAGVVIGGTRVIFDGARNETSLGLSNTDGEPYLVQSWVDKDMAKSNEVPFVVTPPLFRIEGNQKNTLRITKVSDSLPEDRESLFWLNIKTIPSSKKKEVDNTLYIAILNQIKLIYRPASLHGNPEDEAKNIKWKVVGTKLIINNPTPYYMNFHQVKVDGVNVKSVTYASPKSTSEFTISKDLKTSQVKWKIINDYGAVGQEYTSTIEK